MSHFLIYLELHDVPGEKQEEVQLRVQNEMEDLAFRCMVEDGEQKFRLPTRVYLLKGDGLTTDIVRSIASFAASMAWQEYSLLVCQLIEGEDTLLWGNLQEIK